MHKARLENISDAIFAIILTLMVIEMHPPENTLPGIINFIKETVIYGLSYVLIIIFWIHHHYLFSLIKQINNSIIVTNFLLVFFTTLIPLPTKSVGEDFKSPSAYIFYGIIMAINMLALLILEYRILRSLLKGSSKHRPLNIKTILILVSYILGTIIAPFSIYTAGAIFFINPFAYTLLTRPDRRL